MKRIVYSADKNFPSLAKLYRHKNYCQWFIFIIFKGFPGRNLRMHITLKSQFSVSEIILP